MGRILSLLLVALLVSGYTWGKDEEKKNAGGAGWDTAAGTKNQAAATGMPDARTLAAASKVAKMSAQTGGGMPDARTLEAASKVAKISPESLKAAATAAKLNTRPGAIADMVRATNALKGKDGKPMDPKMLTAAINVAKAMNAKKQAAG